MLPALHMQTAADTVSCIDMSTSEHDADVMIQHCLYSLLPCKWLDSQVDIMPASCWPSMWPDCWQCKHRLVTDEVSA